MPFWNSPQSSLINQRKSIWCTLSAAFLQKQVRWAPFFISWLWKRYDYVATGKLTADGKEIRKITLVDKCIKPWKELYEYFIQLLTHFRYYSFLAKWQWEQLDSLLEDLPLDHAVCLQDYSEGYAYRFQDEIQSEYFDINKVSLPVTILYRHSNEELDGVQSTEEEPVICKEHLFVISDDVTQDHDSVLYIQKLISKHFQDSKCVFKNVHEFSDGCAGQHKSMISPVPWLLLDVQSKETSLPLHTLKDNRMLLAHM